jgi:peptidyl-prolyl cis-trans isomerase SDCCAG10
MALMNAFRERLHQAKNEETVEEAEEEEKKQKEEKTNSELKSILTHFLDIDEELKAKVIDANVAENDRFDIYDPRNPLNKRKREESHNIIKNKSRTGSQHHSHSRRDKH